LRSFSLLPGCGVDLTDLLISEKKVSWSGLFETVELDSISYQGLADVIYILMGDTSNFNIYRHVIRHDIATNLRNLYAKKKKKTQSLTL
jgi:hypothetical protein